MGMFDNFLDWFGRRLASRLNTQRPDTWPYAPADPAALERALRPGDVLLVSGSERVSKAIKYLTQSTWSHSALYVGDVIGKQEPDGEPHTLVEVNLGEGCVSAPLSKYARAHTRICRAVSLTPEDRHSVIAFMTTRLGLQYDLRNIFDMLRYLVPMPIPQRFRRQMISLGSGAPTRAICSTLIALAFQKVRYPILPRVEKVRCQQLGIGRYSRQEILHIRHHSLFAPCDFDLSPYFQIVKPTLEEGFNYKGISWADTVQQNEVGGSSDDTEQGEIVELDVSRRVHHIKPVKSPLT
ncbi:MAG: lipo-like protein [Hyphomicrobiaceae bacterium]